MARTILPFLSTLSLRRATTWRRRSAEPTAYFYPRSPCGERRANNQPEQQEQHISIHALLAESDRNAGCSCHSGNPISIHALLAESDVDKIPNQRQIDQFLSTLSLRRATSIGHITQTRSKHFYPRSPCGERPGYQRPCGRPTTNFYPRSPCGERPRYILTYAMSS